MGCIVDFLSNPANCKFCMTKRTTYSHLLKKPRNFIAALAKMSMLVTVYGSYALLHILDFVLILAYLDLKEPPTHIHWSKLIKMVTFSTQVELLIIVDGFFIIL